MRIIVIGGGELRSKETLPIDMEIAREVKAGLEEGVRGNALFVPTASHDSKPYFNTFRKTYTSECDMKVDIAMVTRPQETPMAKIIAKLNLADLVYVGGGDTRYLIDMWQGFGFTDYILAAAERGKTIVGNSAGGICWFEYCYTDSAILNGESDEYFVMKGLGVLKGLVCPHFDVRREDFLRAFAASEHTRALCIEKNCAVVFDDGEITRVLSCGGHAYTVCKEADGVVCRELVV